jgi:hypothetical protein
LNEAVHGDHIALLFAELDVIGQILKHLPEVVTWSAESGRYVLFLPLRRGSGSGGRSVGTRTRSGTVPIGK